MQAKDQYVQLIRLGEGQEDISSEEAETDEQLLLTWKHSQAELQWEQCCVTGWPKLHPATSC